MADMMPNTCILLDCACQNSVCQFFHLRTNHACCCNTIKRPTFAQPGKLRNERAAVLTAQNLSIDLVGTSAVESAS